MTENKTKKNKEKITYLTIDDAPSEDFKNKVDFLLEKNIPAIFFCEGQKLEKRPDDVVYALKKRFVIGNHSYNHIDFRELSMEHAKKEITNTEKIIEDLYKKAGVVKKHKYFRFPMFKMKPEQQDLLKKLGYELPFKNTLYNRLSKGGHLYDFMCTFDTFDWAYKEKNPKFGITTKRKLFERIENPSEKSGLDYNSSSAELIMMHDHPEIKEVFKPIINKFLEKGLKFKLP